MKKLIKFLGVLILLFLVFLGLGRVDTNFVSLFPSSTELIVDKELNHAVEQSVGNQEKYQSSAVDKQAIGIDKTTIDSFNSESLYGSKNRDQARKRYKEQVGPVRVDKDGVLIEFSHFDKKGQPKYLMTNNVNAALSVNIPPVVKAPYHLDGASEVVGVWDGGSAMANHVDFNNGGTPRVFVNDGSAPHWHSTHVSGTIASSGISEPLSLGMSPATRIFSYDWDDDLQEMSEIAARGGDEVDHIYLSNHSYGVPAGWAISPVDGVSLHWYGDFAAEGQVEDSTFGNYNTNAMALDDVTTAFPYLLPFVAAGNDRSKVPNQGETVSYYDSVTDTNKTVAYDSLNHPKANNHKGGYDTISNAGLAKNIITVGAVNDAVDNGERSLANATMTTFSCWGPCDDGRIKPDLVGNGLSLLSAYYDPARPENNSLHGLGTGTSMASPSLTGSANLIQSYYLQSFGRHLLAASLKALLIHTADDLGNIGPDYIYGWGLVNVEKAVKRIDDQIADPFTPIIREDHLVNGEIRTYKVYSDGSEPLKATLVWNDVAATVFYPNDLDVPHQMLVNDLDLKLTTPSNTTVLPWVLDVANPSASATRGDNDVDNVEQVVITNPEQGFYTITVSHKGDLKYNEQSFSIVTSGCTTKDKEIAGLTISNDSKHLLLNEYPTLENGGHLGSYLKNSGYYLKTLEINNSGSNAVSISNIATADTTGVTVLNFPTSLVSGATGSLNLLIDSTVVNGVDSFQLVVELGSSSFKFDLKIETIEESFPNTTWSSAWSGQGNWIVDDLIHAKGSRQSFRSKKIGNEDEVSLEYSGLLDAGEVNFKVKVSSERDWDLFEFLIDGIAQVLIPESGATHLSGEMGWISFNKPITAGNHSFTWKYTTDEGVSRGYSAVWIDDVTVPKLSSEQEISFLSGEGGHISGDLVQRVEPGGDCSPIRATALPGYQFDHWVDNQTPSNIYTANPLSVKNVTDSAIYTACFIEHIAPVEGIRIIQDGLTLTWSVKQEKDVKEYRIIDNQTNTVKVITTDESHTYAVDLAESGSFTLVIVYVNGEEESYPISSDENRVEMSYGLIAGWNLVSLVGESFNLEELLAVKSGILWGWDAGVYRPIATPNSCEGFWVYSKETKLVTITATKSLNTPSYQAGWNLIGVGQKTAVPTKALSVFSWWNQNYETFDLNDLLIPGVGYWIFTND